MPPDTDHPFEPLEGQDGPPDVRTALHAVIELLDDVKLALTTRPSEGELLLRVVAHRSALRRLARELEAQR